MSWSAESARKLRSTTKPRCSSKRYGVSGIVSHASPILLSTLLLISSSLPGRAIARCFSEYSPNVHIAATVEPLVSDILQRRLRYEFDLRGNRIAEGNRYV